MKARPRIAIVSAVVAVLSIPVVPASALTGSGYLDSTFSGDGRTTVNVSGDDTGEAVAIQADGKIVVVGSSSGGTDIAVARFATDGTLDATFGGGDGIVVTDINGDDAAYTVAIQTNQKIVVGGFSDGTVDAAVVRYDTDGTPDTSFGGGDGIATAAIGQGSIVYDLAIQGDGAIVAAGAATPDGIKGVALVARFDSSGVLDTTFNNPDGYITTNLGAGGGGLNGVAIQGDGAIVAAGGSYSTSSTNVAVLRYTSAGALDATFGGGDGKVTTDVGSFDLGNEVTLQGDGKIVVAGAVGNAKNALLRYDTAGTLDTTFSDDGIATVKLNSFQGFGFHDLAIDGSGAIVAVSDAGARTQPLTGFGVARFTTDGILDTTFGGGDGTILTPFSSSYRESAIANSVAIQSEGKIVAAGTQGRGGAGGDIALARYGDAASAVIARPDLQIGARGTYIGDGVYNETGSHQTLTRRVARGHSITYSIKVENDGNAHDTLIARGSYPGRGVSISYSVGGNDITRAMLSFKGKSFALDPAEAKTIKVAVRVKATAKVGKTYAERVEAYSLNNFEREDVVKAKITVGR